MAQQVNDPFVIYENYGKLRACLTDAVYGEDLKELTATISVNLKEALYTHFVFI